MDKLYTTDEVAEVLRCSRWTVIRRMDDGELKAINNGSGKKPRYVFSETAIRNYLDARSS